MKLITICSILTVCLLSSTLASAACSGARSNVNITKPDSLYTDHDNGTVTDNSTGLMWQKCPVGLVGSDCLMGNLERSSWQAALAIANNNTHAGYSDWRLPNIKELISLKDFGCSNIPGILINDTLFPNMNRDAYFWSSTPHKGSANRVHMLSFNVDDGRGLRDKEYSLTILLQILLVRDVQ